MQYKYCTNDNYEDFASGRVFLSKSSLSNFPVRLSQEIYLRCLNYSQKKENICMYDPCCGGGYLLTSLGFLNSASIRTFIGSDIDVDFLNIAKQNLFLLTNIGLEERYNHLKYLYDSYQKASHLQAMESIKKLSTLLHGYNIKPDTIVFQTDILMKDALKNRNFLADIVFTDVPYGDLVQWHGNNNCAIDILLNNLIPILKPTSIVAICSNKQQKINNNNYVRLEKQHIGKRKFEILKLKYLS